MTANELVNQAIDKILSDVPEATTHKEPTISLRGLLAEYGTARRIPICGTARDERDV